jgi:hypothetical protein
MIASLNTGTTAASFHAAGKYCLVRNKNTCTTLYNKTRDIVKSDRFGRFKSLNDFADIRMGNEGKG